MFNVKDISWKLSSLIKLLIQSVNSETRAYSPGWRAFPHPMPQLTTPARTNLPSSPWTTKGPPLSPWKSYANETLSFNFFQIILTWHESFPASLISPDAHMSTSLVTSLYSLASSNNLSQWSLSRTLISTSWRVVGFKSTSFVSGSKINDILEKLFYEILPWPIYLSHINLPNQ